MSTLGDDECTRDVLAYYACADVMTDPQEWSAHCVDLPQHVPSLCRVVQQLLIHTSWAKHYGITRSPIHRQDITLRSVAQMLRCLVEYDDQSLNVPRPPQLRLIGNCRDFAVLLCAFLRYQGIPARARCGFASYLHPTMQTDHWVCEYWHTAQQRWIQVDAELDELHRHQLAIAFDPCDLPPGRFLVAGAVWQRCRDQGEDARRFGFNARLRGLSYIRDNLLRDMLALNKREVLYTDRWWGDVYQKPINRLSAAELARHDRLAALTSDVDTAFAELRQCYADDPGLESCITAQLQRAWNGIAFTNSQVVPVEPPPSAVARPTSQLGNGIELPRFGRRIAAPSDRDHLIVRGACQHNLQHISVAIPRHQLVVITGVSGSGKSSLAFDTIYAEGQRRYVESMSTYARQYVEQLDTPKVEAITGLSPAIAIEQRTISKNPRSTVGTITDIIAYVRLLFSRIGTAQCIGCGQAIVEPYIIHACRQCDHIFHPLAAADFNPHTPQGMCSGCHGLGTTLTVDPDLIVDRPNLSLLDGASRWYGNLRKNKDNKAWIDGSIETVAAHYSVDLTLPWCDLPQHFRDVLLYGSGDEKIHLAHQSERDHGSWSVESTRPFKGACFHINRLFHQTTSESSKRHYMTFMRQQSCPNCGGARIGAAARAVILGGVTIAAIGKLAIDQLLDWASQLFEQLTAEQLQIGGETLEEIGRRLQALIDVGLHYLTLDRAAPTLSGGEGQRIRLATQIGSGLVGVLYILDEPSIGLHPRDQQRLIDTLLQLRDMGNTVLVVEHDAATMQAADWLIDMGPGAGTQGGRVIAEGPPAAVARNPASLTGQYLSGDMTIRVRHRSPRIPSQNWLTIVDARLHTLKRVTVRFPLNLLTCVTGVSGSGKSSLVNRTLFPALQRALHRADAQPGPHDRIEGLNYLNKVINIDQSPIGRTPRSNPATYVGFFDEIRRIFAETPAAQAQGFGPDRFSFNVEGGRCATCQGHGQLRIEMHFLSDVWITCRDCQGTRFNEATRAISYCSKNIADVLAMDVAEALQLFANYPKITRALQTLNDVGLDYLKIGQSATTLSGGEAQRIKLASELCRVATGRTLYILDEPTSGLHFADIQRLLDILHQLIDAGNTVIVIEHNLDVIRLADWIIDMGPGGGEAGGTIVAEGSPATIAQNNHSYTGQALRQIETMT